MSEGVEPIEDYLDALLARLHGSARSVRRMLGEAEQHLYAAYDDAGARGLDAEAAVAEALTRFGAVELVAAQWNRTAPSPSLPSLVKQLVDDFAPLAGLGLVAIGISGVLERIMTAVWGLRFMFADPPGTRYSATNCHYWQALHPHAAGCTAAYLAESLGDTTLARYAAGIVGLAVLGVLAVLRRRQGRALLTVPSPFALFTAAALFAAASVALLALAGDAVRVAGGNGAGQWLSAAIIAIPLAIGLGWRFIQVNGHSRFRVSQ